VNWQPIDMNDAIAPTMNNAIPFTVGDAVWALADGRWHYGRVSYVEDGVVGVVSCADPTMGWVLPRSCVSRFGPDGITANLMRFNAIHDAR